jgi:hypothetical protein
VKGTQAMISDRNRTYVDIAAAMIWLGIEPTDMTALDMRKVEIVDCMMLLNGAAQRGEVRYYDSQLFETPVQGKNEPSKTIQYTYTLQSLIDFAKVKNHKLALLERKAKSESPIDVEKPLSTTERNTLLTIIAAFCKYESIDPQARGVAKQIMEMTDDLGAHVDEGTILRWLNKIPDALETRKK